ncbi:hypothetical protein ASPBRDRAFT_193171 [Aspergillus brasiliensis CBS 101740]|uniref:DH domain-containing protein n=1 Tax=Aspergillus brasiliensis (strain CBS 101740 / IMI 381727 / IBT 21946) TaxID=767769 RepID=A0A1L9URT4_ASPBC|nr:hypothetical protein ASPBRDRAFT_193171 [Aspergillus brasiliensis CBS 101740]
MSHIQSYILGNIGSVSDKLQTQPTLESTLDQALTGCYVVFDVLQSEISKLTESEQLETSVDTGLSNKTRDVWSESTMKDIVQQMRGLRTVLDLLLQLLGVDSIAGLKQLMDQNTAILSEVAHNTFRISASANKSLPAPRYIYDMSFKSGGSSGDSESAQAAVSTPAFSLGTHKISDSMNGFLSDCNNTLCWKDHWSLKPEDLASVPEKEIERQESLHEIIATEKTLILRSTQVIHFLYYYRLALHPSTIVSRGSNQEFAEKVFGFHERFYHLHKTFLYNPMIVRQAAEGPWVTSFTDIFRKWLSEATSIYLEFSGLYPHLRTAVATEAWKNARFAEFLRQSMSHRASGNRDWIVNMTVPMTSLDIYMELLGRSLKTSEPADERHGYDAVESLIHEIQDLKGKCDRIYENEIDKIKNNRFRAQLGPEIADRLLLPNASIIFDQDLPQERRSFREAPTLRVVVLKSPLHSSYMSLKNTTPYGNDNTSGIVLTDRVESRLNMNTNLAQTSL